MIIKCKARSCNIKIVFFFTNQFRIIWQLYHFQKENVQKLKFAITFQITIYPIILLPNIFMSDCGNCIVYIIKWRHRHPLLQHIFIVIIVKQNNIILSYIHYYSYTHTRYDTQSLVLYGIFFFWFSFISQVKS